MSKYCRHRFACRETNWFALTPRSCAAPSNSPHFACVLANAEFETWFVAAAESLQKYLTLAPGEPPPNPEATKAKKKWIADRFCGVYSETVDQPKLTAAMDLALCRQRAPSFDKLCRELEKRLYA